MLEHDLDLHAADIQLLSDLGGITSFFAKLGYEIDQLPQSLDALGINNAALRSQVRQIERLVSYETELEIYFIELKSVTVANTQAFARAFKDLAAEFMFVLTDDYNRIDFVLLERLRAESSKSSTSVRPRVLTVDRRDPGPQALRVLRRFSFTEADPVAQYDKMLSAYTVAEWSAIYYNNRALFSDYYLNERLTDSAEWTDAVKTVVKTYRAAQPYLLGVREKLGGKGESAAIDGLYKPLLTLMGFQTAAGKQGADHLTEPDFRLYAGEASTSEKPSVLMLAYAWNRNLDTTDPARGGDDADEVPGTKVVTLLDTGEADWAIVTNGKLWRLYAAKAHSRATNYYEVDLEEALSGESALDGQDRGMAFLYWWLFFRAAAFVPHEVVRDGKPQTMTFLDEVISGSEDYAKSLGERLKNRVFEDIFPHFAQGFVAAMKYDSEKLADQSPDAQPVLRGYSEADLNLVFHATLTLLYRLMFLLYAESRNLLPIQEARGYYEISLKKLKEEVAEKAGVISDEAVTNIRRGYDARQSTLYPRLQTLFTTIDQGNPAFNMPQYNGGLFITRPEDIAALPDGIEKQVAQFLVDVQVPDQYLALGLDFLSRDFDVKAKTLAAIDFKSLGVRQLGSIYEGLLEFKLMVANEKMAVVMEDKVEKIIPYADAVKQKLKIKTIPHSYYREHFYAAKGSHPGEIVYAVGNVYLINTKQERKATGSYYTPDYIVQYIVQHTVGPVLDEKFKALTPRLREAGHKYAEAKKRAVGFVKSGMTPDDPEKTWNDPAMQSLAHDVFDLKVLDPAMGSGHFLVEVVDYATDRIIKFLQGFPTNPVAAALKATRADILDNLNKQNVTVDPARLTDVALLKRQVLKRCVYGVDLNPMAVELAKVSLWLDAFTLGAPLSFLDHHLKCGNSLIGARIKDVQDALDRPGQRSLLAQSQFTGLMLATDLMARIGDLPDVTIEQNRKSKTAYADAYAALSPFKRILDMYTSRWFGNTPSKAKGKNKQGFDPALEFLRRDDTQGWIADPASAKIDKDDYMKAGQVAQNALTAAAEKRFFHWELEFPEVFFAPGSIGAPGQTSQDAGFDAVVGNPPYDELSEDALGRIIDERPFFAEAKTYEPASDSGGRLNWYHFFMILGVDLLSKDGMNGFIVPMSWIGDSFTQGIRIWLLTHHTPVIVDIFPQKDDPRNRVFPEAKLPTCLFVIQKDRSGGKMSVRVHPGREITAIPYYSAELQILQRLNPEVIGIPLVDAIGWNVLQRVATYEKLGRLDQFGAEPTSGEIIFNSDTHPYMTPDSSYDLILRGSHVQRYELAEIAKQGEPVFLKTADYLAHSKNNSKAYAHKSPRVVYQEGSAIDAWRRIVTTYLPAGYICGHKICYFVNYKIEPLALLAIYGSHLINWLVEALSSTNSLPAYLIGSLPFPKFEFTTEIERRKQLAEEGRNRYQRGLTEGHVGVLEFVDQHLVAAETDVIHDLLAFLA